MLAFWGRFQSNPSSDLHIRASLRRQHEPFSHLLLDTPRRSTRRVIKQSVFQPNKPWSLTKARPSALRSILIGLFGRRWWYVTPGVLGVSLSSLRDYCT